MPLQKVSQVKSPRIPDEKNVNYEPNGLSGKEGGREGKEGRMHEGR